MGSEYRRTAVVGCDDVLLARTMTPSLTTVAAPMVQLGSRAVALLRGVIAGGNPRGITLTGELRQRGTVAPAPV
ncbi:substrate-binding domain-containing protein [Pseudactinotalea sp. Z1739]|uniref:substrate-binding domain-containing protein n=1 Tax=Pseudactinotalea sp. Z1739 TaxID=3413028 RepID=UPI003C7B0A7A